MIDIIYFRCEKNNLSMLDVEFWQIFLVIILKIMIMRLEEKEFFDFETWQVYLDNNGRNLKLRQDF
jgi:hypothetical protein